MRSLPRSLLHLHAVLVAIVAQVSVHTAGHRADVLRAGLVERPSVLLSPSIASLADVGLVLDVPQALAHAGALPGARLKFLGNKEEIHEAKI